jgi:hypothetical protein
MNNTTANELLELVIHSEQFGINTDSIELLKRAAEELNDLQEEVLN